MHTQKQLENARAAIEAVMVMATEGMSSEAQQAFEIDAIALYVGVQAATLPTEQRGSAINRLSSMTYEAMDARLAASKIEAVRD